MIEITEVQREEAFDLNESEWAPVNDSHFGKRNNTSFD